MHNLIPRPLASEKLSGHKIALCNAWTIKFANHMLSPMPDDQMGIDKVGIDQVRRYLHKGWGVDMHRKSNPIA